MSFIGYTPSERVCEVVPEEETCPISYIAVENEKKGQWSLIKHVVQNLHEAYWRIRKNGKWRFLTEVWMTILEWVELMGVASGRG